MTDTINFDAYWGVQVTDLQYDCKAMSMALGVYWTIDSEPFTSRLIFSGVSKFELLAEKIFKSEVVELVSLEGKQVNGIWRIVGELSNYELVIECVDVEEESV